MSTFTYKQLGQGRVSRSRDQGHRSVTKYIGLFAGGPISAERQFRSEICLIFARKRMDLIVILFALCDFVSDLFHRR